jgi:transposase InsO family protein
MIGISKQAVHQSKARQQRFDTELNDLANQLDVIREDHPGCGLEKLYKTLRPETMGRDKFCEIFMELGYRVRRIKNYTRTTKSGKFNYTNLIEGMAVTKPFHVLQTDITYFYVDGRFYYLIFIIDVYTREILGWNVGDNLRAECNLKALKMALSKIPKSHLKTMIHHSDRGSQYGADEYTKLLRDNEIKISMGMKAQDNAYAERVNGTIKNEYLKLWYIPDFKTLKSKTKQAVNHYNEKRLHQAFKNEHSPMDFKKSLLHLKTQERPMVTIYAEGNYKVQVASSHLDFNPREEPQAHNYPMIIS